MPREPRAYPRGFRVDLIHRARQADRSVCVRQAAELHRDALDEGELAEVSERALELRRGGDLSQRAGPRGGVALFPARALRLEPRALDPPRGRQARRPRLERVRGGLEVGHARRGGDAANHEPALALVVRPRAGDERGGVRRRGTEGLRDERVALGAVPELRERRGGRSAEGGAEGRARARGEVASARGGARARRRGGGGARATCRRPRAAAPAGVRAAERSSASWVPMMDRQASQVLSSIGHATAAPFTVSTRPGAGKSLE